MRVLVTGAAGFLGSVVARKLKDIDITVFTTDIHGKVDLTGDLSKVDFVYELPDCQVVIHCAAVQYVSTNLPIFFRKRFFERNNVIASQNLAARFRNDTETKLVIVGTSMMYASTSFSRSKEPATQVFCDNGVYSKSKVRAWEIFSQLPNPKSLVIPCIIGGYGRSGLFSLFISTIKKYGYAPIPGDGTKKIQLVHVDDVADLLIKIALGDCDGIYNAGGLAPLSISEWVEIITQRLGLSRIKSLHIPLLAFKLSGLVSGYRFIAKEQIEMLAVGHVLNIEASRETGWLPIWTSRKIIEDTVDGWLAQKNSCHSETPPDRSKEVM
jgi:nucleoside-diphosphate-sugar epimerase